MRLTEQHIKDFKKMYRSAFGIRLSDKRARKLASSVAQLTHISMQKKAKGSVSKLTILEKLEKGLID